MSDKLTKTETEIESSATESVSVEHKRGLRAFTEEKIEALTEALVWFEKYWDHADKCQKCAKRPAISLLVCYEGANLWGAYCRWVDVYDPRLRKDDER